ncbi:2-hydroxyhepta-2,4-diene-1,7-dioate isomerase [Bacteroidia bacterium]|nr:2-hydroxyhepta-2,4-diene-1,7-dioate isomerase [Bacteroidia bacterium]
MKLICTECFNNMMTPVVVGDNALLRNNKDFYYPHFTNQLSCVPQLVLRISKLGKSIAPHFAHRYYDAVALGIRFYADPLLPNLASSFDESAAVSGWHLLFPKNHNSSENINNRISEDEDEGNSGYTFAVNHKPVFSGSLADLPLNIHQFIAETSSFFTLKVGDLFFCGSPFRYQGLKIGDRLEVWLEEQPAGGLDFWIR